MINYGLIASDILHLITYKLYTMTLYGQIVTFRIAMGKVSE